MRREDVIGRKITNVILTGRFPIFVLDNKRRIEFTVELDEKLVHCRIVPRVTAKRKR